MEIDEIAAHRRERPGAQAPRRRAALRQLLRHRRRHATWPRRSAPTATSTSSPPAPRRSAACSRRCSSRSTSSSARCCSWRSLRDAGGRQGVRRRHPVRETVRMSTVIVALIPNGLILADRPGLRPGRGAHGRQGRAGPAGQRRRVAEQRRRALHRQDRHADHQQHPLHERASRSRPDEAELERLLGDFAASAARGQPHHRGRLPEAFGGTRRARSSTRWSSRRRASGAPSPSTATACAARYVLGAPEMIAAALASRGGDLGPALDEWTGAGCACCCSRADRRPEPLYERDETASGATASRRCRPASRRSAWSACSDELRPKVAGDAARVSPRPASSSRSSPATTRRRSPRWPAQAGLDGEIEVRLRPASWRPWTTTSCAQAAEDATVFGRVTPEQKERLVGALRDAATTWR